MNHFRLQIAALTLIAGSSVGACAQGGSATASASAGTQASAQTNAVTDRYLTSVQSELTGKVDTKNATVGQEVTARTTQSTKLADGTSLPKGTKLVGHVTQVQANQKGGSGSVLAMTFDHAELKGGQTVPLRSVIRGVAPPVSMSATSDDMAMGQAGPVGASASGGGRASAGGGGGLLGEPVRATGQATGGALGGVTADTRGALGTAGADTRGAVGAVGSTAAAATGESVSGVARATALPGVMLSTSAAATESGTLSASGKNIALESGTQITMGVIAR
jgi:hypothetical protein